MNGPSPGDSRPKAVGEGLWRLVASAQAGELADDRPLERVRERLSRSSAGRGRRRAWPYWLAAGTTVAIAGAVVLMAVPSPRPMRIAGGDRGEWRRAAVPSLSGVDVQGPAHGTSTLRFTDGSRVEVGPEARVRIEAMHAHGAELRLHEGRLFAHVRHQAETRWQVHAGPFTIRVTGTRFTADWDAATFALTVDLHEGHVIVDGPALATGIPMQPHQRLQVSAGRGLLSLAPIAELPAPALAADDPGARPLARRLNPREVKASRGDGEDWTVLASRGQHAQALRLVHARGIDRLLATAGASDLLLLGDVARYAGAPADARAAYRALFTRFSRANEAGDAAFALGRLAFETGQLDEAATWFARYARDWPTGPLIEPARGRLLEVLARQGAMEQARALAREYLHHHTGGPHTARARALAADEAEGQ